MCVNPSEGMPNTGKGFVALIVLLFLLIVPQILRTLARVNPLSWCGGRAPSRGHAHHLFYYCSVTPDSASGGRIAKSISEVLF